MTRSPPDFYLPLWAWIIILVMACLAGKEARDMWDDHFRKQPIEQRNL